MDGQSQPDALGREFIRRSVPLAPSDVEIERGDVLQIHASQSALRLASSACVLALDKPLKGIGCANKPGISTLWRQFSCCQCGAKCRHLIIGMAVPPATDVLQLVRLLSTKAIRDARCGLKETIDVVAPAL